MDAAAADEAAAWFFENALDIFVVFKGGVIERANPAWHAFSGWSEAQTRGRAFADFIHPDDTPLVEAKLEELARDGAMACELRLGPIAGEWLWVRARAKGAAESRVLVVIQDVSAERRAAKAQRQAGRVAELLGMTAGVFIWRFDCETREYDLNPLTDGGTPAQPVAEEIFLSAVHPDDRPEVSERWERSLLTGEIGRVEYRHLTPQGYRRMQSTWAGVALQASGGWELLGVTLDVTDLSDARDAALEAAEAKSQFLANMSHEIRTPMNGVLGVLHLLKGDVLTERGRDLLREALASGATLAQILNDIIDFSRAEAGRLDLAPEPTDLAAALETVAGMVRADARAKGLILSLDAPAALGWARLDPVRLRQMIFNLAGNAVKFTPRGEVSICLEVQGRGEVQRLRVEVRDTGIGIPADAQAGLFDRFQQADGSLTRRFGGSGLGLAMTKALAETMGGAIGCSSTEGAGSTFWFEIAAPACEGKAAPDEAGPCLDGLRVLVVEDNPTNRLVATHMLSALGASVETAEDGAQGVACARTGDYDLIFMDIQMPVMDGVQATRQIRALPGPAALTPIVATTANVLAHQIEAYRACGMDGYVAKPVSPAAFLAEIARLAARDEAAA